MTDVLACVRDDGGVVALGSVKRNCADCDAVVWVAPTGLRTIAEKGAIPVCLTCVAERVQRDPDPRVMPVSPEQVQEIRDTLAHRRRHGA
jgi:Fe-S-cluster-containing dehydrogenase component